MAESNISPCGTDCGACEWLKGERQPLCAGCAEIKGKPFWGTCPTYACGAKRGVEHCGACQEFPCDEFAGQFDPNDPEGQRGAVYRIGVLAYRARHGDDKTLDLMRKTGKKHQ